MDSIIQWLTVALAVAVLVVIVFIAFYAPLAARLRGQRAQLGPIHAAPAAGAGQQPPNAQAAALAAAPAGAAVRITTWDWTLGFPSSLFWKIIWIMSVAVVGAVIWYYTSYEQTKFADLTVLGFKLTQVILCLLAVAAIALILRLLTRSSFTWSPSKTIKRIFTVMLVFTALNVALYMLNPTAPLYNTAEGYGHLLFYAVLFIIAAMIDANLEGKTKFAALVMLFITFALIGPRTGMLLDHDGRLFAKLHFWPNSTYTAGTSAGCSGAPTTYRYDANIYEVNKNVCQLRGRVVSGCVTWLDSYNRYRGYSCDGEDMPSVAGISRLKPDATAIVTLNHCKPFASGKLLEKCA